MRWGFMRLEKGRARKPVIALASEYPAEQMRIVQEGLDKEDLLKVA
jgi:hypothetical protein